MIWFFVGAGVMLYIAWWVGVVGILGELLKRIKALENKQ